MVEIVRPTEMRMCMFAESPVHRAGFSSSLPSENPRQHPSTFAQEFWADDPE